jgi:hypothetical protein
VTAAKNNVEGLYVDRVTQLWIVRQHRTSEIVRGDVGVGRLLHPALNCASASVESRHSYEPKPKFSPIAPLVPRATQKPGGLNLVLRQNSRSFVPSRPRVTGSAVPRPGPSGTAVAPLPVIGWGRHSAPDDAPRPPHGVREPRPRRIARQSATRPERPGTRARGQGHLPAAGPGARRTERPHRAAPDDRGSPLGPRCLWQRTERLHNESQDPVRGIRPPCSGLAALCGESRKVLRTSLRRHRRSRTQGRWHALE